MGRGIDDPGNTDDSGQGDIHDLGSPGWLRDVAFEGIDPHHAPGDGLISTPGGAVVRPLGDGFANIYFREGQSLQVVMVGDGPLPSVQMPVDEPVPGEPCIQASIQYLGERGDHSRLTMIVGEQQIIVNDPPFDVLLANQTVFLEHDDLPGEAPDGPTVHMHQRANVVKFEPGQN